MFLVLSASLLVAAASTLSAVAINVATGGDAVWFPTMDRRPLWWATGSVALLALAAWLLWWAQRRYEASLAALIPAAQRPEPWMVDRPRELTAIVRALRRRRGSRTVGITTAVHGAGGFGKTTIARLVRADRRVLRHFGRRVYWVTLGRDARRGALVEKINDLVRQIDPARAQPFTDVRQASDHLAAVLADGPRRLVILDDVWFDDQLSAFPAAGRAARLVTTRISGLVIGQGVPVRVDQMSAEQARRVLTADLPAPLPPDVVHDLLVETGNWPLLLRLINKVILDQSQSRADLPGIGRDLLEQLRSEGALEVDRLTGADAQQLDVNDPAQRDQAVRATIEAGTGLLTENERARFAELAVFIEDEVVPMTLAGMLWRATGAMSIAETRSLSARLARLALMNLDAAGDGTLSLHDVIRDYLARALGPENVKRLHGILLDARNLRNWWELAPHERYLRDHLIEHLVAAGRAGEAASVATDLRWVTCRLEDNGPASPAADLAVAGGGMAERLGHLIGRTAHLLAPTEPARSRSEILIDRLAHDDDMGEQARALSAQAVLSSAWHPPDLPDPAFRRGFYGQTFDINALAIASDGSWLASAGEDGVIRIWDADLGEQTGRFAGPSARLTALAIAPDDSWIVSGDRDGVLSIWNTHSDQPPTQRAGHDAEVTALLIAPGGDWFASGCARGAVKVWSRVTGREVARLRHFVPLLQSPSPEFAIVSLRTTDDGHTISAVTGSGHSYTWVARVEQQELNSNTYGHPVMSMDFGIDGNPFAIMQVDRGLYLRYLHTSATLALGELPRAADSITTTPDHHHIIGTAGNGSIFVKKVRGREQPTEIVAHHGRINALAVAPDSSWFASAGADGTIRTWHLRSLDERAAESRLRFPASAIAVAPDGSRLVYAGDASRRPICLDDSPADHLHVHVIGARAIALHNDGRGIVAVTTDGIVEHWSPHGVRDRVDPVRTARSPLLALGPGGRWVAAALPDGQIRLSSLEPGGTILTVHGHPGGVTAIAVPARGERLASAGADLRIRIWDAAGGVLVRQYQNTAGTVRVLAFDGDGRWLYGVGDDRAVRRWDTRADARGELVSRAADDVTCLAVSPDDRWLAITTRDGSVRILDLADGEVAAMTRVEPRAVACAWHPDGTRLFAGGDRGLYCFRFRPAVRASPAGAPTPAPQPG
ncbi:NB-ARC domain-containing protein [Actinoplanes sp. OR16]|uniref:NB-ARC domain-containing protein n=1 Tax=Actinoplanes sp. OR16 TaxID=946334 RepID=UPI001E59680F|nr:NB-ARC domain-containing protein [Actinoplanes sp. OR16]